MDNSNVSALRQQTILDISTGKRIEDETTPIILDQLLEMNYLGFITMESQPANTYYIGDSIFKNRSYVNGFYPHHLMDHFVDQLFYLNSNIIVSETILDPHGYDKVIVYNFTKDDEQIVFGKYGMSMSIRNNNIRYITGYSGNVHTPAIRDDYMEDFNHSLLNDMYHKRISLIQIWSKNIDDDIFPIIVEALKMIT